MGISMDASEGPGERNHVGKERSEAIRIFVLGHFEREFETGVLVPICSEREFREHLNVKWNLETGGIQVEASDGSLPLISTNDEWLLATKEFSRIQNLAPEPLRRRAIARRQLAKNTDDWLASFGEDNPASLAMIGERALQRWEATADPFQLELATRKLKKAASQGDSQAAYRLASYQIVGELIDSKRGRYKWRHLEENGTNYLRRAALAGHHLAKNELEFDYKMEESRFEDYSRESLFDDPKEELARIYRELDRYLPLADQSDTSAQLDVARLLNEMVQTIESNATFFLSNLGEQEFERKYKESLGQRKAFLLSAASDQAEARYLLVSERIVTDDSEVKRLLRSATYPPAGERPCVEAFADLARLLSTEGALAEAEECLRDAIGLGVADARIRLADLLYENPAQFCGKLPEAVAIYEEMAPASKTGSYEEWEAGNGDRPTFWGGSAKAALRAGLAYLHGEGVGRDPEKARRLFATGSELKATIRRWQGEHAIDGISGESFDFAGLSCELASLMGWGGDDTHTEKRFGDAVGLLRARFVRSGLAVESGNVLQERDVIALLHLRLGPSLMLGQPNGQSPTLERNGDEHYDVEFFALIRMMSEPTVSRDEIRQLLDVGVRGGNPESLLLLAWMEITDRFGELDPESAEKSFDRVKNEVSRARREAPWREDGLSGMPSRSQRLIDEAELGLRRCADVKVARESAKREAQREIHEIEKKVLAEQAKREAVEDMMAMFAHKFRGSLDSILFNTTHRMEAKVFADAARTMNGLLDVFSVVSMRPEKLVASLQSDQFGDGSPESVLFHSLKLALIQLLSPRNQRRISPHYLAYAKRSGSAPSDLTLSSWAREERWQELERRYQSQWESDVGNMLAEGSLDETACWMREHLVSFRIDGFSSSTIRFAEFGPTASLLTVVFTEVLVNAIKHSDSAAQGEIVASWQELPDGVRFICTNSSTRESRQREASRGSGRGHSFLKAIAGHLGGSFVPKIYDDPSCVTFFIPPSVMRVELA